MVASEAAPFCKTGGLADVLGALPEALKQRGENVGVVIPAYRSNRYPTPVQEVYRNLRIALGKGYNVDLYACALHDVPFYFVDCPELYDRDGIYNSGGADYPDNHLRFAVLSMAAIEVARRVFRAQILHCHDWQTGLAPVYLRRDFSGDPTFTGSKALFTIHNQGFHGLCPPSVLPDIGLDPSFLAPDKLEFYGQVNLLKAGIVYSDWINTVSKTYAREIQTPEYGFRLDGLLRARSAQLSGILNGVDYQEWNPENNDFIARNYSADDLSGKRECKRALLAEMGLPEDLDRPLIGIVSRFADQKGFGLIAEVAYQIAELDLSLVVLGSGDHQYESLFRNMVAAYPHKIAVRVGFDNPLAHRIEAGADMFLMPSLYEPCGLNQMYSLRYGTLPIVRATGGLDDTIEEGTGFKFWDRAGWALLSAIQHALSVYHDPFQWTTMIRNAMRKDFSWNASAGEYIALYQRLLGL